MAAATAIFPKIKLNSGPTGKLGGSSTTTTTIHRPSPTPSKTLPGASGTKLATAGPTPSTPSVNGVNGASAGRNSDRRRTNTAKFGGSDASSTTSAGAGGAGSSGPGLNAKIKRDKSAIAAANAAAAAANGLTLSTMDEDGEVGAMGMPPRKKLKPMPRVITTQYILDKYKDKPPSLVLHMHPTHFRFDQQDGTFNYNSAMRSILEYIAQETIPADAVEVFREARLPYYEGRLIVHIHDHRTATKSADGAPTPPKNEMLFSLNKYNEHLTPSPFVPFPSKPADSIKEEPTANGDTKPMDIDATPTTAKPAGEAKKIYKTVLHPTPASLHAEICLLAITPAVIPARGRHGSVVQTPATPATANPLSITTKNVPMILNDKTALTFEADYLLVTAPPLILTPAETPEEASAILATLAHPLHSRPAPPKKTRKRTVREMAVDEAKAAEEERLMLIMDERHQPSAIGGTDDGPVGKTGGSFEPSFKRWKTLESIKQKHEEERIKKDQEKRAQVAQAEKERKKEAAGRGSTTASPVVGSAPSNAINGVEQSPVDKTNLREMIAKNGVAQAHAQKEREAKEAAAREIAQQRAQEQAAKEQAAREAHAAAQQQAQAQAQAAAKAAQEAREQQAREHQAHMQAQQAAAHAAQVSQTPTSMPQTTGMQGSPVAAASSPFQGSPPLPSRTPVISNPGSRQQSPHMSQMQNIQHTHAQQMPGSPAIHASPMMRAGSQAMHGSPAMTQGSPLGRQIGVTSAGNGVQNITPQMAQHLLMQQQQRQQHAHNMQMAMLKNNGAGIVNVGGQPGGIPPQMQAAMGMAAGNPDQQKLMLQRAFLMRQQMAQQQAQNAAIAAAQHQHQQQQQHQGHGMDGSGQGGQQHHPGMVAGAGRGFVNMGANGQVNAAMIAAAQQQAAMNGGGFNPGMNMNQAAAMQMMGAANGMTQQQMQMYMQAQAQARQQQQQAAAAAAARQGQ